jgi:2,5-diketo-D-gluconate reductase A
MGRPAAAFDGTLAALGTETIDLFLIHWPLPTVIDFVPTWRALERVYAEGRARAVGVSNFQEAHLRRLAVSSPTFPAKLRLSSTYVPSDRGPGS